jgi:3-oxoacyl-[acyl-carrier-protein] synthase-3
MLYLHGLGHFHPENVISNRFLSELDIGSDEDWIMERVGIEARRTSLSLEYIKTTKNRDPRAAAEACVVPRSAAGKAAARMALERAGISAADIGMVLSGTSTPGYTIPAEASIVAAELGIEAPCMELNAACSTAGVQLGFLSAMEPARCPDFILLVHVENYTHAVDYSDRRVAPLFGDGCSAAVVSRTVPARQCFFSLDYASSPESWHRVQIPLGGHFYQDGSYVQRFAIRRTTEAVRQLREQHPLSGRRFRFVGHQANLMMLSHVCQRCGIPEASHWHDIVYFGNTGCAGAPAVLSRRWESLSPGDHVAMVVVGAGLTWAQAMLVIGSETG